MGKQQVRVIVVRKPVTAVLLVLITIGMVGAIYLMAGHTYANENRSTEEMFASALEAGPGSGFSPDHTLTLLMPVVANVLFFVPWGFLAFIVIDKPTRRRGTTYVMSAAGAVALASAMVFWQSYLPARVTSPSDAVANTAGALAGAIAGHVRKQLRVQFDVP